LASSSSILSSDGLFHFFNFALEYGFFAREGGGAWYLSEKDTVDVFFVRPQQPPTNLASSKAGG